MTWNYRLIKHVVRINDHINHKKINVVSYGIYEVFYNKRGQPISRTQEAMGVVGSTPKECWEITEMMSAAILKPVLTDKDFIKPKRKGKK